MNERMNEEPIGNDLFCQAEIYSLFLPFSCAFVLNVQSSQLGLFKARKKKGGRDWLLAHGYKAQGMKMQT